MTPRRRPRKLPLSQQIVNQCRLRQFSRGAVFKDLRFEIRKASKKSLSDLFLNKQVNEYWEKKDRYQRVLGKVTFNERDICLEQVKRGMAWHYKQYQQDQTQEDRMKYELAEKEAQAGKLGLWTDESPVEPSKFRHNK